MIINKCQKLTDINVKINMQYIVSTVTISVTTYMSIFEGIVSVGVVKIRFKFTCAYNIYLIPITMKRFLLKSCIKH